MNNHSEIILETKLVLKVLKFKAAGSIEKEAVKESKRRFEYEIDF